MVLLQIAYIFTISYFAYLVICGIAKGLAQSASNVRLVNKVPTMGWQELRRLAKANGINTYGLTAYAIKNLLIHKLA